MAWFNQIPIWILIQITFQYRFITNTSDIFSNSKEKGVNSGVYWKFERREILCSKIWLGSGNIPSFLINRYWCLVLLQVPKCFGLVQFFCARPKFIFILWQSQTFCARQKDDLHSVKLVFVPHKSFWRGTKYSQIFGLVQKFWTGTKRFGTLKRTRHEWIKNITYQTLLLRQ